MIIFDKSGCKIRRFVYNIRWICEKGNDTYSYMRYCHMRCCYMYHMEYQELRPCRYIFASENRKGDRGYN